MYIGQAVWRMDVQSWPKISTPLVNMIKEGWENVSALLILLIFHLKKSQKSKLSLDNKNLKWGEILFWNKCFEFFCQFNSSKWSPIMPDENTWQEIRDHFFIQNHSRLEVFTEDPGPDPGHVWVQFYILNGQPGPGRVPIYYFRSRVFLTLCVIPKSIWEHRTGQRSASISMRGFNLQFVKLGWEKYKRQIRWKT